MFSGAGSSVRHALVLLPVGGRRITVRTSAPDSSLPSPGTRATLSYAAVMPKLVAQAGSAFTGALTIPARAAGTGWIIIRSSALASLPAAGTRVGPANATNMPKIQGPGTGASFTPIIDILAGARQWRLVGLEV